MKLTIATLLLFVFAIAAGQDNFSKHPTDLMDVSGKTYSGWIVTLGNDTVAGTIRVTDDENFLHLQVLVRFTDSTNKEVIYAPSNLAGYGIIGTHDTMVFESVANDIYGEIALSLSIFSEKQAASTHFFLRKLVDGYYDLYYIHNVRVQGSVAVTSGASSLPMNNFAMSNFPMDYRDRYINEEGETAKNENGLTPKPESYYCLKKEGGKLTVVNEKKFFQYFTECRTLLQKIYTHQYGYEDMVAIVSDYNDWKQSVSSQSRY